MKRLFFAFFCALSFISNAQTIVLNEVSNGPSGTKEYMEFVVTSTSVVYNCVGTTTPPCIDIRGWIFDDNNGYHGPSGIAGGCLRFSNDPFWSCIPVGTILLIYNDGDPNANVPPNDYSLAGCNLVLPVSDATLFERNSTTPTGTSSCSYPAAGWNAGGTWNNIGLNNTSDCARIVNLAGCEVFSMCYGAADNLNNMVYDPGTGTARVFYFANTNSNDATLSANWINGCASPGTCGTDEQTPGAPNNAANAAWIASMNNSCTPIPPLGISSNTTAGTCPCSASAAITATGSIPGYSYVWSPSPGFGQNTPTASGLCNGNYTCVVTSTVTSCSLTAVVTVTNGSAITASATNTGDYCPGATIQLNTPAADSYTWSGPGGFASSAQNPTIAASTPTMSGTYTVGITIGSCTTQATTSVTVHTPPAASASVTGNVCIGEPAGFSGGGGSSYQWNGPNGFTSAAQNPSIAAASASNSGTYSLTVTGANTCTNLATVTLSVAPKPLAIASATGACVGNALNLNADGGNTFLWNGPASYTSSAQSPVISNATAANAGVYTVSVYNGSCFDTAAVSVEVYASPTLSTSPSGITYCTASNASLTATGDGSSYSWTGPSGFSSSQQNPTLTNLAKSNEGIYIVTASSAKGCLYSASVSVIVSDCSTNTCSTIFIPEGFSPNGDGAHDNFVITCIDGKKTKVEIYNRWGNLVFKEDDYRNTWAGKVNSGIQLTGEDLPVGTYYYVVKIEGEDKARTGYLTLWR